RFFFLPCRGGACPARLNLQAQSHLRSSTVAETTPADLTAADQPRATSPQPLINRLRLRQSLHHQLLLPLRIPVRIFRCLLHHPLHPSRKILRILRRLRFPPRDRHVNRASRRVHIVVQHRILRFVARRPHQAPPTFLEWY